MKDAAHHLRQIQRKIIRLNRKEELLNHDTHTLLTSANHSELKKVSSKEERRQSKLLLPSKRKAPAYY